MQHIIAAYDFVYFQDFKVYFLDLYTFKHIQDFGIPH